jgi:hypothetical protein
MLIKDYRLQNVSIILSSKRLKQKKQIEWEITLVARPKSLLRLIHSLGSLRISSFNMTRYVMVTKNLIKNSKNPEISLEFRASGINGQVDSYQDSADFNSRNQIDSFNQMNSPTTKLKRDSIYKVALQKSGGSNKMIIKPVLSEYDSFYSTGSNASSREDMEVDTSKGSRSIDRKAHSQKLSHDSEEEGDTDRVQHKRSRFGRDV